MFKEFAFDYLEQIQHSVLDSINLNKVKEVVDLIQGCKGTVWLVGNGGSASLASHMATDLQLAGVKACALTDVAAITTYANDFHFGRTFQKQVELLCDPVHDLLIAITTSGSSANVVQAVLKFQERGGLVVTMLGKDGGYLKGKSLFELHISSDHVGIAQDGHQIALHIITYWLMKCKVNNQ